MIAMNYTGFHGYTKSYQSDANNLTWWRKMDKADENSKQFVLVCKNDNILQSENFLKASVWSNMTGC